MEEKLLCEKMLKPYGTALSVLIDGLNAKCVMGPFGTWSDRIVITFEKDHPEYGKELSTKHFEFLEPGVISIGNEAKKINIRVLDEENSFNDFADQHPMN